MLENVLKTSFQVEFMFSILCDFMWIFILNFTFCGSTGRRWRKKPIISPIATGKVWKSYQSCKTEAVFEYYMESRQKRLKGIKLFSFCHQTETSKQKVFHFFRETTGKSWDESCVGTFVVKVKISFSKVKISCFFSRIFMNFSENYGK